jgi:class 3 adenylate cyclase
MDNAGEMPQAPAAGQGAGRNPEVIEQNYKALLAEYRSVYDLARSGATAYAQTRFDELGLADVDKRFRVLGLGGESKHVKLRTDIGSLGGRLAKDRAVTIEDESEHRKQLLAAADIYEAVFKQRPDDYPLINVAALRLWAGDQERSRQAARLVLDILASKPESAHDYWHFATLAEAHLLLGDRDAASRAIETAARREREAVREGKQEVIQWQAFASTRRQLERSCGMLALSGEFLAPLRVPPLIVYAGDRPGPRLTPEQEPALSAAMRKKLAAEESHIGVGGLAAGAEILFAEALLAQRADLHVVLAFPTDMFIARAVAPYGEDWVERFERCLGKARTVKHATNYGYQGHSAPVRYAFRLAMGQAVLRGRSFDVGATMLTACDAGIELAEGSFDPSDDVAFWLNKGRPALNIRPDGRVEEVAPRTAPHDPEPRDSINAAVLFGDLHGFSKMPESSIRKYAERILGGIGAIFDGYDPLLSRNSWGDAIFAQFDNVSKAAHCAADVQDWLKLPENAEFDAGVHMSMRIGLHYGPVQKIYDRVQGRTSYMGIHVVEAARIEPIAVPGMIYVSEAFAVALAIDAEADFVCDYLGEVDTAKKYGKVPLYELRRRCPNRKAG